MNMQVRVRSTGLIILLLLLGSCNNSDEPHATGDVAPKPDDVGRSSAFDPSGQWSYVPLPDISKQPISLRVANVSNPRFEQIPMPLLQRILERSRVLVKQHFDIEVRFAEVAQLDISDVFATMDERLLAERRSEILDIRSLDAEMRERMQQAIFKTLSTYHDNQQGVIEYAKPYLVDPGQKIDNFIELSYALVDTLIDRLQYWNDELAADGKPVLNSDPYNQWVWWDSLGYGRLPYDIVVTNQLVASAETYGMDVHSSLRGGITAGTTTYDKMTRFKSYAYVMLYPMLNDTELLTTLRADAHYTQGQIVDYTAALLTHEIGHLLLHLGHPFGNDACVMSPTVMLHYRQWFDALDASACQLGSSVEMTPGAVELEYNRGW